MVLSRAGAGRSGGLRRVGVCADALLDQHPLARWAWRRGDARRRRRRGFSQVSLFWRPEIRRSYATETAFDRAAVKVMSYNVRSFYGEDGRSSVSGHILRLIEEAGSGPDLPPGVQCPPRGAVRGVFAAGREVRDCALRTQLQAPDSGPYGSTLTILSKYRILRSDTVLTPSSSVWADVIVGEDTVRVFNNHLRSTAINASDSPVHHQPSVSLGHGARDQNPQYRDPFRARRARFGPRRSAQYRAGCGCDAHAADRLRRFQRYAHVVCLPHDGAGAARRLP